MMKVSPRQTLRDSQQKMEGRPQATPKAISRWPIRGTSVNTPIRMLLVVFLSFSMFVPLFLPGVLASAKAPGSLVVTAPSLVRTEQEFTIKVTNSADGNHVEGAKVYLISRYEPLSGSPGPSDLTATTPGAGQAPAAAPGTSAGAPGTPGLPGSPAAPKPKEEGILLGTTGANGELATSVKEAGKYFLKAEKETEEQAEKGTTREASEEQPSAGSALLSGFTPLTVVKKEAKVTFTTDKHVYKRGETVTFTLYNGLDTTVTLTSTAPWSIGRPDGSMVFAPIGAMVLVDVKPGETRVWTWDQKGSDGNQVMPGFYLARLDTAAGEFTARFNVAGLRFEKGKENPEPALPPERPFKDVTGQVAWGDPHILRLHERNIVRGITDDTFDPEGTLTRAQFVALLLRASGVDPEAIPQGQTATTPEEAQTSAGKPSVGQTGQPGEGTPTEGTEGLPFPDVTPQHWAYRYIVRAREMGIIQDEEYPEGFGPDEAINRLEICVMAMRAMGLEGEAGDAAGQELAFQDQEQVTLSYRGYVKAAVDWGIVRGYDDNTFRPFETATRRQACVMIYRMMQVAE